MPVAVNSIAGKGTQRPAKKRRKAKSDKDETEDPMHVEGVFKGEELYLRDPCTNRVFSSQRSPAGRLVYVGHWDAGSKSVVLEDVPAGIPQLGKPPAVCCPNFHVHFGFMRPAPPFSPNIKSEIIGSAPILGAYFSPSHTGEQKFHSGVGMAVGCARDSKC